MSQIKVKIEKKHPDAVIPSYAKYGDAGLDLTAVDVISDDNYQIVYDTGLAFEIPEGYVGLVYPRSSIRKYNLTLANSVGVIDSGYRGTIQLTFNKIRTGVFSSNELNYNIGDRVGQLIIIPYPFISIVEGKLGETDRGEDGHGSTGI